MKRDINLDIAKGIGIVFVVLGHTKGPKEMIDLIYCFHMPLFFIISGYLFNFEKWKDRFNDFLKSRIERLIIPYFITVLFFFYPFWFFLGRYFGEAKILNVAPIKVFIGIFYGSDVEHYMLFNGQLWFILCLFVGEMIFFFVIKYIKNYKLKVIIVLSISAIGLMIGKKYALPWSFDIAMVVQVFFLVGYILKTKKINSSYIVGLSALLVLLMDVHFFGSVSTSNRSYGCIPMYFIGGVSGTLFVLWISNLIAKIKCISNILSYLGMQSMTVFMWHAIGFKVASVLFVYVMGIPLTFAQSNYYIIYSFIAIVTSLLILYIKNKTQSVLIKIGYTKAAHLINW